MHRALCSRHRPTMPSPLFGSRDKMEFPCLSLVPPHMRAHTHTHTHTPIDALLIGWVSPGQRQPVMYDAIKSESHEPGTQEFPRHTGIDLNPFWPTASLQPGSINNEPCGGELVTFQNSKCLRLVPQCDTQYPLGRYIVIYGFLYPLVGGAVLVLLDMYIPTMHR